MTVHAPHQPDATALATATPAYDGGVPTAFAAFESPESAWRTLTSFAVYRLVIVLLLAIIFWGFVRFPVLGAASPLLAALALSIYMVASVALIIATQLRIPSASVQLSLQVLVDIAMLVLLMHASGGSRSGIGMLLLISLAAGALVTHGRMAFFHAAVAALAVLFEQLWQFLYLEATAADFVPSGMLATGYFVIAGLGYTLAKYARGAEEIAEKRGVDLANMAQINELVIRDMQDGFLVVDEEGTIRQQNRQSASMIGGIDAATGQKLKTLSPQLDTLLAQWREDRERIFPIIRDAQTQREMQLRFVAVGGGQLSPTVIFIEDASRVRAQAQQMKLVALGRLTASIAHEIRNPLSSINHAAELLEEEVGRSDADRRLLNIIRDNSHRLDRLVEEVLYLNRRDRAHPEALDLESFLTIFIQNFCANEKLKPSLFSLKGLANHSVMFDRTHLDQILWNLARNASRYASAAEGAVMIEISTIPAATKTVELAITDDGPGVEPSAVQHLFEPFFTTDTKGTGLGLYIARELAEVNDALLEYVVDNVPQSAGRATGAHFRLQMKSGDAMEQHARE